MFSFKSEYISLDSISTDITIKTTAQIYVLQVALNAIAKSDVACHVLGMVYDPGIGFSLDSMKGDDHLCPNICPWYLPSPFITLFSSLPWCSSYPLHLLCHYHSDVTPGHSQVIPCLRSCHIFLAACCLVFHTLSTFMDREKIR